MKNSLFIFFSLLITTTFAQRPQGMGQMPAVGRLYGKVLDAQTKEPVAFATITLTNMRDSLITGTLVKNNGDFALDKLLPGRYKLKIQFLGFKNYTQNIVLVPNNMEMDLGNIKIEQDAKNLKEVTVQGQRQTVSMSIDKRTYTVDKDISATGGTGLDVMKNLPGVTVDGEGNVSLRNGSPTVFIDGRPSVMTLEQIPAEQIDRVEIITNPSAKYDASTTGGILNVILKKNTKPGYNGMVNAGIGTNNRYNSMVNLNIKEGAFNFFVSYNLNARGNLNKGYTYRTNFQNENITSYFKQDNITDNLHTMQFGRIGFDYQISNRNTITISQAFNSHRMQLDDEQVFKFQDKAENVLSNGKRITDQSNRNLGFTSQIMFKHNFPKQGKELTSDVTYNSSSGENSSSFTTTNYNALGIQLPNSPEQQINKGSTSSNVITYQLDYTNPLSDSSKLEAGIRSNYKVNTSLLDVQLTDSNRILRKDVGLSNNFDITDIVNAAYVNYSNMIGSIGYQLGVRFEQTYFVGRLTDKNQEFRYVYPDGTKNLQNAFFPSLYLNKRWGVSKEAQLNFSRKINRPGWMQIMPFIMFADRQSYRIGNPTLAPEFINTIEGNYNHIFNWGNFLSSGYMKITQNSITNYVYTYVDSIRNDSSILVSTFINGNNAYATGWENTLRFTAMKKKLDITLNGHVFYTQISASTTNSGNLQNQGFSWNTKLNASYKLPKGFTVQVNTSYEAPRIIPQGKTREVYFMDISLAKEFTKRFSMNFTVSDVFNTKVWGALYNTPSFEQDFTRRWESRYARITLSWRFGEMDNSIFKRKPSQRRPDSGGEQMEF